ncbi:MAG TPA: hypothetical protein PKN86_15320, partial [Candidatus Obscuribacter sp.]|nr:hypothetical protein [Candidatus Obscuribacter sp.]
DKFLIFLSTETAGTHYEPHLILRFSPLKSLDFCFAQGLQAALVRLSINLLYPHRPDNLNPRTPTRRLSRGAFVKVTGGLLLFHQE